MTFATGFLNNLQELQVLHTETGYGIGKYYVAGIDDEDITGGSESVYDDGTKYIYKVKRLVFRFHTIVKPDIPLDGFKFWEMSENWLH